MLIGTAVVVDDCLAEVKAIIERSAGDETGSGVDGFDPRISLECAAWALRVGVQFAIEGFVDLLRFVRGSVAIVLRIFNTRAGLLKHVVDAGAGPWSHAEKDRVDVTKSVKPHDCGIDPAVHRDVGRIER